MPYPGGKNGAGVYQRIISMMPPHHTYIEPFLGGGAVMKLKRPAALNIGLDLSAQAVVNFRKLLTSPYSPLKASIARNDLVRSSDPARSADTGRRSDSGSAIARNAGPRRRLPSPKAMPPAAAPKMTIQVGDGLEFLESSPLVKGGDGVLVYCDPPYLRSTRSGGRLYEFEMPDVDHRRLLRWAIAAKCRVMLSGYWSEMYISSLRSWRCCSFWAMTRGGMARECLWYNFPPPVALHDYRYLGEGFRERERIKRKKSRWVARLEAMPLLERQALLSAIADSGFYGDASSS